MSQSRILSALEAIANAAVGMLMTFTGQVTVFPLIGLQATLSQTLGSGCAALSPIHGSLPRGAVMLFGNGKE